MLEGRAMEVAQQAARVQHDALRPRVAQAHGGYGPIRQCPSAYGMGFDLQVGQQAGQFTLGAQWRRPDAG